MEFTYILSDPHGATPTETVTVTITVTGVNDAPTASAATLSATEDGPAVTTGVLGDDVDDDDTPTSLTYTLVPPPPSEGTVTLNANKTFSFHPGAAFQDLAAGQTRIVTFSYFATDSHGATSPTRVVTVTVTGGNERADQRRSGTQRDRRRSGGDNRRTDRRRGQRRQSHHPQLRADWRCRARVRRPATAMGRLPLIRRGISGSGNGRRARGVLQLHGHGPLRGR